MTKNLTGNNELLSRVSLSWLNDGGLLSRLHIICRGGLDHITILKRKRSIYSERLSKCLTEDRK